MSSRTIENKPKVSALGAKNLDFAGEVFDNYDDLDLKENLLRGVYGHGWEKPTPVQQRAIKPVITGKDLIAQAQSGTGKTGAFSIGALQIADDTKACTQVIILSPTRELADQSYNVINKLATYTKMRTALAIGGSSVRSLITTLKQGPQIVVGTPGRMQHMIDCQALRCDNLQCLIIDEADEMLDRGFQEVVYEILQYMPKDVQICLFSATFPQSCLELAAKFMREPTRILVKQENLTLDGIFQYYINCEDQRHKLPCLIDLYEFISVPQVIIFCNTISRVEILAKQLTDEDFTVSCIHGSLEQEERNLRMQEFRTGSSRVLIATDIISRGIDVQGVSLVINYDIPFDYDNYLHRIGRSGRHGRKGVAINFLTDDMRDVQNFRGIEAHYSTKIEEFPHDVAGVLDF